MTTETFESLEVCVCSVRLVVLQRPPATPTCDFLVDFASLLDNLVLDPTSLFVAGDPNLPTNSYISTGVAALRDLLSLESDREYI